MRKIDCVLRDDRANEVRETDRELLDLIHEPRRRTRTDAPIHVISSYRSTATNDYLRAHRRGGVGYYPRSKFVHVDVDEPRTWRG